ncbi:TPA: restriction endonuclease subunit S [Staphylococcus aureus]|nr:restriction endonuclease subunit S [Staphylococcus aureus]HEH2372643.1 restriction endonuclease subunit S [Staphylococcus aureus]
MNKQTNTPELRFPEFDEEWKKRKLGEVVNYKNGGSFESLVKNHGVYKLITLKSVNTEGKLCNSGKYIDDKCVETLCNDTLIMILSEQAPGLVGMTAIIPNNNEYVLNQRVAALVPKQFIDSQFLSKLINRNQKYFSVRSAGTKVKNISKGHVENFNFLSPNYTEQQKIGNFFSKLDRQIELEEEKLELLEQQKRGYIQKIFSQDLRFKDENGNSYPDWSIKKIEDISKVNKGFTPNTKNDKYWDELNENWLSIAGMTQKYLYKGNKGITEKGASKHVKVDKDTLIMSFKLTLGKLAIVKEPIYTNEAICHFVWKESNVNTEYMYYYLNSINISTFGAQAVKGVTLNNDAINSIIVKLPVIQEQNKIAYFFNKLDKLIEKQSSKVELLKQRKQGFLQKMFV